MTALGVAVWGLGPHALKNILPAIRSTGGLRLAGVVTRNPTTVAAACAEHKCGSWETPQAMLASQEVDAVFVSTPIALHAQHGLDVLRAGKHLWCEKPMVEHATQANDLVELSRQRGLTVGEGFMYLYHAQFRRLISMVRQRALGEVRSIVCRFGIPPLDDPRFRADPALGGGAFLDVGSYPVSAADAFFPDSDPDLSFAEIIVTPPHRVDTEGRALLRYGGEATVFLEWRSDAAYRSDIDIWCTRGSVSSERIFSKAADYVPTIRVRDFHGRESVESGRAENHFITMLGAFLAFVRDPGAAEAERQAVVRRARLLDRIRSLSARV